MVEYEWPRPKATVDVVLFTVGDRADRQGKDLLVALAPRAFPPFEGAPALPGSSIHSQDGADEELADTALRVLRDQCGVTDVHLEQLGTEGGRRRDPAGWSVTTAYSALVRPEVAAASDRLLLRPARGLAGLPFDHDRLVERGVRRLVGKATYTTQPSVLLPDAFTLRELEECYEAVLGRQVHTASFRRKVEALACEVDGVAVPWLQPTGAMRVGRHRPAALYRKAVPGVVEFPQMF